MKITDFHWEKYSFPFRTPFKNSGYIYRERQGFYLFVEFDYGNTQIGECAPLPGVNRESIGDIALELEQIEAKLPDYFFSDKDEFSSFISSLTALPSLRFAFAQIIDSCTNYEEAGEIKLEQNSVISASGTDEMMRIAKTHIDKGFSTLKLKIGVNSPDDEIELIKKISSQFPHVKLRLDSNSIFELNEAIGYLRRLSGFNIEYIEDPVATVEEMYQLSEITPIPLAADIFISSLADIDEFLQNSKINHFVIKPMAFADILLLSNYKFGREISITLSSSFESFVGRIYNYFLASRFEGIHGLATSTQLAENISELPFDEDRANIVFIPDEVINWLNKKVLF
ncbi:MAG: hypothetical protein SCALA702_16040 [Melioribacteraceae bacterium]|nr:MAG: hypothetical protein SCALA702_16040 [Melioribacteraceae bacterium]